MNAISLHLYTTRGCGIMLYNSLLWEQYYVYCLRHCLDGGALALFSEMLPYNLILHEVLFRLYKRRAGPPRRNLTIEYPRSRL